MSKVVIIGAGGVGNVVAHKCAEAANVFDQIVLASRRQHKCEEIAEKVYKKKGVKILPEKVDADDQQQLINLLNHHKPDICIHVALPYQDLKIMEACLRTGVHYLDTANYEAEDMLTFEYKWQWKYFDSFKNAGITGLLGCGFDPGVTSIFVAYARKHYFDEIQYLDIIDCNAGSHGEAFATNFNSEINIREVTQKGLYWENGAWKVTEPLAVTRDVEYPEIGTQKSFLMYHEELESLVKNFPELKRARFWMTFSDEYIKHLQVLQNIGMTSIEPIEYEGKKIVPLKFLTSVLPKPAELGDNYSGKTSIGCQIRGIKDGRERTYFIYTNTEHQKAYQDTGSQAVSYTTGVPAMVGGMLVCEGTWQQAGVFNVEEFDPDPFLKVMPEYGLTWQEETDKPLSFEK